MKLLITGFIQVFFVAINTFFISKVWYGGVFICGFIISYIWCWNIKRVSVSNNLERVIYSFGASIGGVSGLFMSKYLYSIFS